MKMYILIRDDVPLSFAALAAAHASLATYLAYRDEPDMIEWAFGGEPFYKVVCRVNETEFERAKTFDGGVVMTESALGDREVAIGFKPRKDWPKPFRFYALYR